MPLTLILYCKRASIYLVSLDPIFYSNNPNICTVARKNEEMCNILNILCNEKQIERGKFKSILSEKEPEKRFEKFQEIILTSGTTVFQQFMK